MAGRVSCVYAYLSTSTLSPDFNSTVQWSSHIVICLSQRFTRACVIAGNSSLRLPFRNNVFGFRNSGKQRNDSEYYSVFAAEHYDRSDDGYFDFTCSFYDGFIRTYKYVCIPYYALLRSRNGHSRRPSFCRIIQYSEKSRNNCKALAVKTYHGGLLRYVLQHIQIWQT